MELGNQVSCKVRGGWAQGGGQRDNPREEALHSALLCKKIRNTLVLPGWGPQSATHTGSLTLDGKSAERVC